MTETDTKTEIVIFAKFIKEKRLALGKTIPDLSEEVFGNRKNTYIRQIESGKRTGITIQMMAKILKVLNSEIAYKEN